jgi:hypothetical protein
MTEGVVPCAVTPRRIRWLFMVASFMDRTLSPNRDSGGHSARRPEAPSASGRKRHERRHVPVPGRGRESTARGCLHLGTLTGDPSSR